MVVQFMQKFEMRCFMKYIAPTITHQHTALSAILGMKGTPLGPDGVDSHNIRETSAGYESDE
jgi:hypothetical protein